MRHFLAGGLLVASFAACDGDVLVGEFVPASQGGMGGTSGTATTGMGEVSNTSGGSAGAPSCIQRSCNGKVYDCGDCEDNDGTGDIDSDDPDCLGPCHNSETTYYGSIPGQSGGNCERDCYFDNDSGAGNDDCHWNQGCDPLEPVCAYDPDSCEATASAPSEKCLNTCLPLVPNGCDCFGCCEIPGGPTTPGVGVWLGSEVDGEPSCDRGSIGDPERCKPCTMSTTCVNRCGECELCVGKLDLPASCDGNVEMPQDCPLLSEGCGLAGQSDCASEYYCITGCCILTVK